MAGVGSFWGWVMLSAFGSLSIRSIGPGVFPFEKRLCGLATMVPVGHPPGRGLPEVVLVVVEFMGVRQGSNRQAGDVHRRFRMARWTFQR